MDRVAPPLFDPFISKVSLSNFKSVVDQEVDLGRLTLLVGENSSGKSSILQVLRLLQQSLQSESVGDRFPLNGDFIRMGTIEDIRTTRKDLAKSDVSIGIEMMYDTSIFPLDFRRSIHTDSSKPMIINWGIDLSDIVPDEPGSTYLKGLRIMCSYDQQHSLVSLVKRRGISNTSSIIYGERPLGLYWGRRPRGRRPFFPPRGLEADLSFKGNITRDSKSVKISGLMLFESLPLYVTVKRSAKRVLAEEWLNRTIEENEIFFELQNSRWRQEEKDEVHRDLFIREDELRTQNTLIEFANRYINTLLDKFDSQVTPEDLFSEIPALSKEVFSEISVATEREKVIKKISKNLKTTSQFDVINSVILEENIGVPYIREVISRIRYLGPLREEPQFVMLTSPTSSTGHIGSKGESTAAVLYNHLLSEPKLFIPLPNEESEFSKVRSKKRIMKPVGLIEGIKAWSAYLGLVEDIHIEDLAALGLTIKVKPHGVGSALSLPSVGVGVSQLLPVLVLCLLAEPGSVILLEQPELHLHPALQQRLADFFIAISRSGRQLIVETHSEYIISRLRRRIAEDADDELMKLVKVIFAERDRETGETQYRDLDLTPYGDIEEWPKGFFDQAAEDEREIIRGALKKQKARKPSDLPEGG